MTVIIRYQEDGSVTVRSPYNEAFLADFKQTIPIRHRRWRSEDRVWWVSWRCADDAIALCRSWFDDVEVIFFRPAGQWSNGDSRDPLGTAYACLHLLPTAPWELVESAYRVLARLHHPDRGGETRVMQRLNDAYREIKQQRGTSSPGG